MKRRTNLRGEEHGPVFLCPRCLPRLAAFFYSAVTGTLNFIADSKVHRNHKMACAAVREERKKNYLAESRPHSHKVAMRVAASLFLLSDSCRDAS